MALQQSQPIAYPEWTEYRKKNGLDPLGMQTGSVNIYQRLLPGISNVTLRIRYYRSLCLARGHIRQEDWRYEPEELATLCQACRSSLCARGATQRQRDGCGGR